MPMAPHSRLGDGLIDLFFIKKGASRIAMIKVRHTTYGSMGNRFVRLAGVLCIFLLFCYLSSFLSISTCGPHSQLTHVSKLSPLLLLYSSCQHVKTLLLALHEFRPARPDSSRAYPNHGGPRRVFSAADVPGDGKGGTPVASLPVHLVVSSPSVSNRAVNVEGQAHGRRRARRLRAVTAARVAQSRQRFLLARS